MRSMSELIEHMKEYGVLKTPKIEEAFRKADRKYFVPDFLIDNAYEDRPLPIGKNQTISQPSTVAFMLELLEPKEGDKILDIGSGSGWTSALLCFIVGDSGLVIGLERVDELVEMGRRNLSKFNFKNNCKIEKAKETLGLEGEKFDKILVSAAAEEIPYELFDQLKENGILVIPIKDSIFRFIKTSNGKIKAEEYYGFRFVPLIYEKKIKSA